MSESVFANAPENIIRILKNNGLYEASDKVVVLSDLAFQLLGFTASERSWVKQKAATRLCNAPKTASELLKLWSQRGHKITFGCSQLDMATNGGLPIRGITEIAGEAGSGKSQLCMQLALTVQRPLHLGGLGKKAVYITTEGRFPIRRLEQMQTAFNGIGGLSAAELSGNIFVQEVATTENLMVVVAQQLPQLCATEVIGLVIIDSIAAPLRLETDYIDRAARMRTMVRNLLNMSRKYEFAVVCVNQVTSNGSLTVPSLGLAWANLVNTRIQVSRLNLGQSNLRNFDAFSSELASGRVRFVITDEGVQDFIQ